MSKKERKRKENKLKVLLSRDLANQYAGFLETYKKYYSSDTYVELNRRFIELEKFILEM